MLEGGAGDSDAGVDLRDPGGQTAPRDAPGLLFREGRGPWSTQQLSFLTEQLSF